MVEKSVDNTLKWWGRSKGDGCIEVFARYVRRELIPVHHPRRAAGGRHHAIAEVDGVGGVRLLIVEVIMVQDDEPTTRFISPPRTPRFDDTLHARAPPAPLPVYFYVHHHFTRNQHETR